MISGKRSIRRRISWLPQTMIGMLISTPRETRKNPRPRRRTMTLSGSSPSMMMVLIAPSRWLLLDVVAEAAR